MADVRRLTALAIAHAMQAGAPTARGLVARMRACLGRDMTWCEAFAQRCAALAGPRWERLTARSLAAWIERDPGYRRAWSGADPPNARHHILRAPTKMAPPPLGLHRCAVPMWPHPGALADWLGVSPGGMWRLTKPAAWQRRLPLGEQHYQYRMRAKRAGGWRLLEIPAPHLRALQRRLLDDLIDRIPPHEAAMGYVRERSVIDHARAHAGQAVVLQFDLEDFFPSVPASRVHALFRTLGYSETVARELTALCTTATPEPVLRRLHEDGSWPWTRMQRFRDAHLPQGAPTSPALANLCAFRLDLRLDGLAHGFGACYTRYADDLAFSGGAHLLKARHRLEQWVARIALEEGFALNHRKTRCRAASRRQTVCHIVVNERTNLQRSEFDRLKAVLHACVRHGPAAQNREGLANWRQVLQGRVAWAVQLNAAKGARLVRLLERIDWSRSATSSPPPAPPPRAAG